MGRIKNSVKEAQKKALQLAMYESEINKMFANRFTESDIEFQRHVNTQPATPPLVVDYQPVYKRWNPRFHNNYERTVKPEKNVNGIASKKTPNQTTENTWQCDRSPVVKKCVQWKNSSAPAFITQNAHLEVSTQRFLKKDPSSFKLLQLNREQLHKRNVESTTLTPVKIKQLAPKVVPRPLYDTQQLELSKKLQVKAIPTENNSPKAPKQPLLEIDRTIDRNLMNRHNVVKNVETSASSSSNALQAATKLQKENVNLSPLFKIDSANLKPSAQQSLKKNQNLSKQKATLKNIQSKILAANGRGTSGPPVKKQAKKSNSSTAKKLSQPKNKNKGYISLITMIARTSPNQKQKICVDITKKNWNAPNGTCAQSYIEEAHEYLTNDDSFWYENEEFEAVWNAMSDENVDIREAIAHLL